MGSSREELYWSGDQVARNNGSEISLELAREGANVVVKAKANRSAAEAAAKEAQQLGMKTIATLADVSDKA